MNDSGVPRKYRDSLVTPYSYGIENLIPILHWSPMLARSASGGVSQQAGAGAGIEKKLYRHAERQVNSLECHLSPHCERIEFRARIAEVGGANLLGNVAVQVVEQESDVSIDIPVQARGVDRLAATGDTGRGGKLIVEVYRADTAGNLPSAPAAARQRERMLRYHAQIGCRGRIVLAGFAGQDKARLGIAALELQAWRSKRRKSRGRDAIDIEPEIFTLEEERSVSRGSLDAVDLCARNVRDGAGRYQGGRVDPQLSAFTERQRLCSRNQVVRRVDQELRVRTQVQRILLAAHDLPGDAGGGAELLGAAVGVRAGRRMDRACGRTRDIAARPEHVVEPARANCRAEIVGRETRDDPGRGTLHERDIVRT